MQVQNPNRLLVLETESGRQVARAPLADGEALESAPVPIDEDHVLLVPDRRTVKNFDLGRGLFTWDYRESPEMPVNGPPRVLVDAERVLVLHDGRLLIRLDPVSGAKRWSSVLGTENLSDRLDALACDERRVYCVSQQTLRALAVDDGSPLWTCYLTGPENAHLVDCAVRPVRAGLSEPLGSLRGGVGEHARRGPAARDRRPGAAFRLFRDDRGCQAEAGLPGRAGRNVPRPLGPCSTGPRCRSQAFPSSLKVASHLPSLQRRRLVR